MKKYILLIISIIIFIIKFLDNWFRFELMESYFLESMLFSFFIFIFTIVLLLILIIKIYKKKDLKKDRIALCFLVISFCFSYISIPKVRTILELEPLMNKRMVVIEKIKNGELLPRENEIGIYLDEKYKNVSPCNRVRVYKNDEEGIVIGFLLMNGGLIGKDTELIYTTGGKDLIFENKKYPTYGDTIIELKEEWFYVIQY